MPLRLSSHPALPHAKEKLFLSRGDSIAPSKIVTIRFRLREKDAFAYSILSSSAIQSSRKLLEVSRHVPRVPASPSAAHVGGSPLTLSSWKENELSGALLFSLYLVLFFGRQKPLSKQERAENVFSLDIPILSKRLESVESIKRPLSAPSSASLAISLLITSTFILEIFPAAIDILWFGLINERFV